MAEAVAGALSLGAGLIAFLYPAALSVAIAVFIGWFLLIGGVAQLIGALAAAAPGWSCCACCSPWCPPPQGSG